MNEEIRKQFYKTTNITIITAILSLTIIEIVALMHNIDGQVLSLVIGAISGLAGLLGGQKIAKRGD